MAASPRFKIYSASGEYMGCTKYAEDAAAFVGLLGEGATVRYQHRHVIWTEGAAAEDSAAESFDAAATLMRARLAGLGQNRRSGR